MKQLAHFRVSGKGDGRRIAIIGGGFYGIAIGLGFIPLDLSAYDRASLCGPIQSNFEVSGL